MSQFDRIERDLAGWFSETAMPQTPDYLDDILRQTARRWQRPRWTFLERLLPMTVTTSFRAATPGLAWRTVGLLLLLSLALVAGLILVSGSQRRLPAPFGPAAAGLVAYSTAGDIYSVDRATGQRWTIATGLATDVDPQWSRDGTKLVFERKIASWTGLLFVVNADGTQLTQITPQPVPLTEDATGPDYTFSPDGSTVVFVSAGAIQLARTDGSGVTKVPTPTLYAGDVAFRPGGADIAFVGQDSRVYLLSLATGERRMLVESPRGGGLQHLHWSPDGSKLAFQSWENAPVFTVRARVIDIATGQVDLVDPDAIVFWDALPTWSNDGTRIALVRGYADAYEDVTAAIVPADGSAPAVETSHGLSLIKGCCAVLEWAPDDSTILWAAASEGETLEKQVFIDPNTGEVTPAPWSTTSDPAWQRLAPP